MPAVEALEIAAFALVLAALAATRVAFRPMRAILACSFIALRVLIAA
jgi:hypothetical protein